MPNLSSDQEQQLREFINANQLILAIKLYREITGVGLAEAKSAVEALARGENVNIPAPAQQSQLGDPFLETKIRDFLAKGNKIEAIKLYRLEYNVGLAEAKSAVEALGRGGNINFSAVAPQSQLDDSLLEAKIKDVLVKRSKIEAIKLYREVHHVGLKEAKDIIDQMEASMRQGGTSVNMPNMPMPSAPPISNDPFDDEAAVNRMRLIVTIVVLLALGGAVAYFLLRGLGG
jgi:ribosomal protein L7/L12